MSFHVRRKDREITDAATLKQVLKSTTYITIALAMNNEPYLVALSHGYDETKHCLYFHCASEGKKLVYLKANPKIWGQAVLDYGVTDECDYAYTCVHFAGTISLIDNLVEKQHGMEVIVRQLSTKPEEKLTKIKPEKLAKTTMGRIDIVYMTGKQHRYPKP
ncbi:MAG: pyridoxamine 5'-phosphate oxidase family protein [Candidatus Bathyarchaeota archaeon]|nr:pyridoxamine 5'-phosphate oxidase family protein [Candidatus Bathyarchaeota archaeon]